jgi:hypothetical protein
MGIPSYRIEALSQRNEEVGQSSTFIPVSKDAE